MKKKKTSKKIINFDIKLKNEIYNQFKKFLIKK